MNGVGPGVQLYGKLRASWPTPASFRRRPVFDERDESANHDIGFVASCCCGFTWSTRALYNSFGSHLRDIRLNFPSLHVEWVQSSLDRTALRSFEPCTSQNQPCPSSDTLTGSLQHPNPLLCRNGYAGLFRETSTAPTIR